MNYYKVLGLTDTGDIKVKQVDTIPTDAKECYKLTVENKTVDMFWWDIIPENAICGKYAPQFFIPSVYENKNEIYIKLKPLEDLTGVYPLNKFVWKGEEDPKTEADLHTILLEA